MRAGAWKATASVDPVILVKEQTLQQVKGGRERRKPTKRHITGTEPERCRSDPNYLTCSPLQPVWAAVFKHPSWAPNHVPDHLSSKSGNSRHNKKAPACSLKLANRTNAGCKFLVSVCQGHSRFTQSAEHLMRFHPSATGTGPILFLLLLQIS